MCCWVAVTNFHRSGDCYWWPNTVKTGCGCLEGTELLLEVLGCNWKFSINCLLSVSQIWLIQESQLWRMPIRTAPLVMTVLSHDYSNVTFGSKVWITHKYQAIFLLWNFLIIFHGVKFLWSGLPMYEACFSRRSLYSCRLSALAHQENIQMNLLSSWLIDSLWCLGSSAHDWKRELGNAADRYLREVICWHYYLCKLHFHGLHKQVL